MLAVDGSEFAVVVGPFVPDGDAVLVEVVEIGFAADEPEQFVDDAASVDFFGGEEWEAAGEVEADLMAEGGDSAGAGAVGFVGAVLEDVAEEVVVWGHERRVGVAGVVRGG